jgi:V8-like Glu-specific endopeptidase
LCAHGVLNGGLAASQWYNIDMFYNTGFEPGTSGSNLLKKKKFH